MLRSLQLLLPALLPSWGFFDAIQPAPRIQYQWLDAQLNPLSDWQEFRPRPAQLSISTMLQRLLWNARWNETLFLMSCAERILEHHTAHSEREILERIVNDWRIELLTATHNSHHVRFRLLLVQREQQQLSEEVRFTSQPMSLPVMPLAERSA